MLVAVTPGQDMALVLRNTLRADRRAGIVTGAGVVSGLLIWGVIASAGLTAVLLSSRPIFSALKIAGALYLVYLGVQSLRSGLFAAHAGEMGFQSARDRAMPDFLAYRQGLLSNLGNPKIAVFYSGLLPQFVGAEASFGALLVLGLLFCLIALIWLTSYALVLDVAGAYMRRSRVRRAIETLTGTVLLGLALRLATARR